jgi:hypothetical protein
MASKASENIPAALQDFSDNVRIPATLICEMASEQTRKNTDGMTDIHRLQIKSLPAKNDHGMKQNHRYLTATRETKIKCAKHMRARAV